MSDKLTYPEGFDALLKRVKTRRAPLTMHEGEELVGLDVDLNALRTEITSLKPLTSDSGFSKKIRQLQGEFAGQPELCWLNGFVIANLRKDDHPAHAVALFQKIWTEHSEFLLRRLPLRWLISSITTFGDKGVNETQRHVGRSLTMMFGMIKLYEFERLYTGTEPTQAFSSDHKLNAALPLDIPSYSLKGGGLDIALLTRIWKDCSDDPVIEPLAKHLLNAINDEPGMVFRRLQVMSGERRQTLAKANNNPIPVPPGHVKREPEKISWAVAATLNEDLDQARRFAAHHLALGAHKIVLFGEDPSNLPTDLAAHPKIIVELADQKVISENQRLRLPNRNARKAFYFNRTRRALSVDWLAMLDTDEFLVTDKPIPQMLSQVPEDAAFLAMPVLERFAGSETAYRAPSQIWALDPDEKRALFPTYFDYVTNLLLGPTDPRLFVRAKLKDIRVVNFLIKYNKRPATNSFTPDGLSVAHTHADSFAAFLAAMPRRLDQGYARRVRGEIAIKSTLEALDTDPDSDELINFFEEIASARPEVLQALQKSGDLRHIDLNLEEKVDLLLQEINT